LLWSLSGLGSVGGDGEGRGWGVGGGDWDVLVTRGQDDDREDGHCAESTKPSKSIKQANPLAELTDQLLHRASPILNNCQLLNEDQTHSTGAELRVLGSGESDAI
jgi:hypothetical protein